MYFRNCIKKFLYSQSTIKFMNEWEEFMKYEAAWSM